MARRSTPNHTTPWIAHNVLSIPFSDADGTHVKTLIVDTAEWFAWLAHAERFYVQHAAGNFACRKEARKRGGLYWVAYRRQGKRVVRVHIGSDEHVTAAALATVAQRLATQFDDVAPADVADANEHAPPSDDLIRTDAFAPFADILKRRAAITSGPLQATGNAVYRRVSPNETPCVALFSGKAAEADAVFFANVANDIDRLLDGIAVREAAAAHFFDCIRCVGDDLCPQGQRYAQLLGLVRQHDSPASPQESRYQPAHVVSVTVLDGLHVQLVFHDETTKIVDMDRYLSGHPLFEELRRDPRLFRAAFVETGAITWPNGADIDSDVLYLGLRPHASEEEYRAAVAAYEANARATQRGV